MTEYQLRPYQVNAVRRGIDFLLCSPKGKNGLAVYPTGAGKSLILANIVKGLDGSCMVFQPSKEILEQNLGKFRDYGYEPAVFSASMRRKDIGQITLVTIQSVVNAPEMFPKMDYGIIDECHVVDAKKGMFRDFLNLFPGMKLYGVSASPWRLAQDAYSGGSVLRFLTRTKPRVFDEVVDLVQIADLMRDGYLIKPDYHQIKGFDRKKVKLNSNGSEYDQGSLLLYLEEIRFADNIVRVVQRLLAAGRKNVLVFTQTRAESEYLAQKIPGCAYVTSATRPKERARIGDAFRRGEIKVVSNVGVYGVGFDYPELETVLCARPTMSLTVAYQQMGRVLRTHPNKKSAWIVDMVGLIEEFGKIEDFRFVDGGKGKWYVSSNGKQLTNVVRMGKNAATRRYFAKKRLAAMEESSDGTYLPTM